MTSEEVLLPKEVASERNSREGRVLVGDPHRRFDPTLDPPEFYHPLTHLPPLRKRLAFGWALLGADE
jgi:hypothetical protein